MNSFVAEVDGRVVAIATVGPDRGDRSNGTIGELWMLNVLPEMWGRGIGSDLLAAASGRLTERGCREAVLWVVVQNTPARRLYERVGWTVDGAVRTIDIGGQPIREIPYRRSLAQRDQRPSWPRNRRRACRPCWLQLSNDRGPG